MNFVDIIAISLSSVFLSVTYHMLLSEGMIFEKLGTWLDTGKQWYKKPLGACIYCASVYISIFMIVLYLTFNPAWAILSIIALSFFLINLIVNYELL